MYIPVCVCVLGDRGFMHMSAVPMVVEEAAGSPGPGVAGSSELPDLGTRNQGHPLPAHKSGMNS